MRKAFVLAAVTATAALSAATAQAAIYTVHIDGQIIQQLTEGSDPRFGIGTPITFDTSFDGSRLLDWGDTGYQVGFLWHNGGYTVQIAGLTLSSFDDYMDGVEAFYTDTYIKTSGGIISDHQSYLGRTDIVLYNGEVVGVSGGLAPAGDIPGMSLGNAIYGSVTTKNAYVDGPVTTTSPFGSPPPTTDTFKVGIYSRYYLNSYTGPEYLAQWDFEDATVSIDPVPEPAAWALMIVGFGLAGSAIRRRRALAA
jgi:hypothetical protein